MNRIIPVIVISILIYLAYIFVPYLIFGHFSFYNKNENFISLLSDTAIIHVDTTLTSRLENRFDACESYFYLPNNCMRELGRDYLFETDTAYFITIWKFKKFEEIDINEIQFRQNQNLSGLNTYKGEVLDSDSNEEKYVEFGYNYNKINLNLDEKSEIKQLISGRNYRGFIAKINRISFSNEDEKHQIFIDYAPSIENVIFLIYKSTSGFFVLIINSRYELNEKAVNIFNFQ